MFTGILHTFLLLRLKCRRKFYYYSLLGNTLSAHQTISYLESSGKTLDVLQAVFQVAADYLLQGRLYYLDHIDVALAAHHVHVGDDMFVAKLTLLNPQAIPHTFDQEAHGIFHFIVVLGGHEEVAALCLLLSPALGAGS